MQDIIAEDKDIFVVRKKEINVGDLDYLTSVLHARYSKMAKGDRLVELSRIENISDFFQSVYPDKTIENKYEFQKRCIFDFISEVFSFYPYLPKNCIHFVNWMVTRFQLENYKILLKGFLTKTPFFKLKDFIINLSGEFSIDIKKLYEAEIIEDFIKYSPKGFFQDSLKNAIKIYGDKAKPFFYESFLDSAFFKELALRTHRLNTYVRKYVKPIIDQEIDIFHLMLITRGKIIYNLPSDELKPFHIEGTAIPKRIFYSLLNETDIGILIKTLEGRVIDSIPSELSKIEQSTPNELTMLEALAWKRFCRLCNKVFYLNHMGFGAVVGYIGLKRIEIINLIALSEGIDGVFGPDFIRRHLIQKDYTEVIHV